MLHHGQPTNSYKALLVTLGAALLLWILANVVQAATPEPPKPRPVIHAFKPVAELVEVNVAEGADLWMVRIVDPQLGVVCYSRSAQSLDCVKITKPL